MSAAGPMSLPQIPLPRRAVAGDVDSEYVLPAAARIHACACCGWRSGT